VIALLTPISGEGEILRIIKKDGNSSILLTEQKIFLLFPLGYLRTVWRTPGRMDTK
jgi:hypothetical protein